MRNKTNYKKQEEYILKIVLLSGSIVGNKTRTAINYTENILKGKYPEADVTVIDLADFDVQFSDGRNYLEYEGDTKYVTETIMQADAIILGTPIFQAGIPATLKNIFDLLPVRAFQNKIASIIVTAGSPKHYLIAENHLKPMLGYMKAQIVQTYLFIEEQDFLRKEIVNDDILFRLERMVEDTVILTETYTKIREEKEAQYGF